MARLAVEIWSDVVCPWCYLGKRRFAAALAHFPQRADVRVTWRSFELDPEAPRVRDASAAEHIASKYGMSVEEAKESQAQMTEMAAAEGLHYDFDRARGGNTFDAHRLIHLAAAHGRQDAANERLMRAYLSEGEPIGDREALVRVIADVGIDADEAGAVLDGDAYAGAVRADEELAAQLGIRAVPYFVLDRRYGVPGAQPAELLLRALERAWQDHSDEAA
jgi:predicted DsbA family dithiol-disulfide isomerase